MTTTVTKTTLLFPGSFNPFHRGHEKLVRYFSALPEVEEVVVIPTPRNPVKQDRNELGKDHHIFLTSLGVAGISKAKVSDLEYTLEAPFYTYKLIEAYMNLMPKGINRLSLLIGGDNLSSFHQWKNYADILGQVDLWVYPRVGIQRNKVTVPYRLFDNAPLVEVSSTDIRRCYREKLAVSEEKVSLQVNRYIKTHQLY